MSILTAILGLLIKYRYILLFPIAIIEGPIIAVIAGFLISIHIMSFSAVLTILVLGDLTGDTALYWIGRTGSALLNKFGKYVGITQDRIKRVSTFFNKHPLLTLFFGKWSHAFGFVILTTAGIIKIKFWKYIFINLLGTLPKVLLLVLIGYYFGQAYLKINSYLDYGVAIIVATTIFGVVIYLLISKIASKYFR